MFLGIIEIIDFVVTLVTIGSSIAAFVAKRRAENARARRLLGVCGWGLLSFGVLILLALIFHIPLFPLGR